MSSAELSRVDSGLYISNCYDLSQRAKEREGVLGACGLPVSVEVRHLETATRSHIIWWGQLCASTDSFCVPFKHCFGSANTE
jgi:hypothetical protein